MNINYISNLAWEAALAKDAAYPLDNGAEIYVGSYDERREFVVFTFNGYTDYDDEQRMWLLDTDDGWRVIWAQADANTLTGADFLSSAWDELPWQKTGDRLFEDFKGTGWVLLTMPEDEEDITSLLGGATSGITAVMVRGDEVWSSRSAVPYKRGLFYSHNFNHKKG